MLNFTGIKDKNIRHVERKEILKLCPDTRFSEEKRYRQRDEKIAALFFMDVRAIYIHRVISNAGAHNALFS